MTTKRKKDVSLVYWLGAALIILTTHCASPEKPALNLQKGSHIVLVGNNLPSA